MSQVGKPLAFIPVLAFMLLGVFWGSNFIYMKLASNLLSTTQIVFFRVLFGFLPVLIYSWLSGALAWSQLKYIGHFFVMALIATTFYYYFFVKGTSLLLSGVAGAISGSIPLFTFILAVIFLKEEKVSAQRVIGVLVGLFGVFLIARPSGQELLSTNLEGLFYIVAGSLSGGASYVYARKYISPRKILPSALTTYQLGLALLLLSVVTDYNGIGKIWTDTHASLGLVVGLGLLGTGGAYLIYYYIVDHLGAVVASSVNYIPPIVALLIGSFIVGEPIEFVDCLATAIIFFGVFLLKRRLS
ncbi:MAG: membrane protein [Desulfobulbaceae bacterium BRH_c16a]|nr:MAG: membrane protein [Desulfobulbaceae bacterium BRH_c16a]